MAGCRDRCDRHSNRALFKWHSSAKLSLPRVSQLLFAFATMPYSLMCTLEWHRTHTNRLLEVYGAMPLIVIEWNHRVQCGRLRQYSLRDGHEQGDKSVIWWHGSCGPSNGSHARSSVSANRTVRWQWIWPSRQRVMKTNYKLDR